MRLTSEGKRDRNFVWSFLKKIMMRYIQVLVFLLVVIIAMVIGAKVGREPKCLMTYTPCANGKLNITFTNNPNNQNTRKTCNKPNVVVDCISKKNITKKTCDVVEIATDYTPCGAGNATFFTTKTAVGKACPKYPNKSIERFCNSQATVRTRKAGKGDRKNKMKKNKDGNKQKAKQDKKARKQQKRQEKKAAAAQGKI